MKYLLFCFTILLLSCSKPVVTIPATQSSGDVFYKVTEVDVDGSTLSTPIKYISVGKDNGEGEDDDDDENHCPLPIKIESFTLMLVNQNVVRISWSATNEDNVDHYVVERSMDSKNWLPIANCNVSNGDYIVNDKPQIK